MKTRRQKGTGTSKSTERSEVDFENLRRPVQTPPPHPSPVSGKPPLGYPGALRVRERRTLRPVPRSLPTPPVSGAPRIPRLPRPPPVRCTPRIPRLPSAPRGRKGLDGQQGHLGVLGHLVNRVFISCRLFYNCKNGYFRGARGGRGRGSKSVSQHVEKPVHNFTQYLEKHTQTVFHGFGRDFLSQSVSASFANRDCTSAH